MSLDSLLEETRTAQRSLPHALALRWLRASIRLAAGSGSSLRPRMLLMDQRERLTLEPPAAHGAEDRPGYVAPEVNVGLAAADDPQALVYTAGALGYELFTLRAVPDRSVPASEEVPAWLGTVLRKALAPRHRRYQTLEELNAALSSAAPAGDEPDEPAGAADTSALIEHEPEPTHPASGLAVQMQATEERAAELERTLAARDAAAAERIAELEATIDALQERVRVLSFIANAAAKAPRSAPAEERPSFWRRRARRPLVAVSTIVMVAAAIGASVLAIRGDVPARDPVTTAPDAQLIRGTEPQPAQR